MSLFVKGHARQNSPDFLESRNPGLFNELDLSAGVYADLDRPMVAFSSLD